MADLTDLIAADLAKHRFIPDECDDEFGSCSCLTWRGPNHDRHVALVVEQHTNGRIANWQSVAEVSRSRELNALACAEKAEAAIARVEELTERAERHGNDLECADVRAALEGEQQ